MAVGMKKIFLGLTALAALYLGGRWLWRALASDETKIRWIVERMEAGYDRGKPGACIGPLAKDWRHQGYELDRELLRGALIQATLQDRDPQTKQLLTRVDVDPATLAIEVDGDRARLSCLATFHRLRRGTWEETWRMRAEAELQDGEDGWEIVRSAHQDLRGTQLGR